MNDTIISLQEANFASDFGGVLGLWVGCSILSIFEFVELAMDYVVWIYFTCKKKCKPASGKENTTEGMCSAIDTNYQVLYDFL